VTIGGTTSAARNVISGNEEDGVYMSDSTGGHHIVQGNYIGTNKAGTAALGNGGNGITAEPSGNNLIGGTTTGARNVISANAGRGVALIGPSIRVNTVQGNYIGTKADGTGDLGNGEDGVALLAVWNTLVGGNVSAAGNLISGNGGQGVYVDSSSPGSHIERNVIRLNDSQGLRVDAGPTFVAGNLIFQNDEGVRVGSSATGVRITANQIFGNDGRGINLLGGTEDAFGVTANDTDDPDTGANNLQNFPVLTAATRSTANGLTTVAGTLNSNPSTEFKIELFLVVVDESGHGEAQALVASQNITTNSGGDKSFTFFVASLVAGQQVTATATSVTAGNTSEFSLNRIVTTAP
jgi:hypothetical protein